MVMPSMNQPFSEPSPQLSEQPLIVRYVENTHNEIRAYTLSRCAVGYILHGEKSIYYGDKCYKFGPGEVFFLGMGRHYLRNNAEEKHPFEQLLFFYSSSELQRILLHLNMTYRLTVSNPPEPPSPGRNLNHASMPAWELLRLFFEQTNACLNDSTFHNDTILEDLKMTELLYLLVSHRECPLRSKLLSNVDSSRDAFRQTVYAHIFSNISIEELAAQCNRSLTSFKKEFNQIYGTSPHQWFIRQRLIHARLLLISTDKPVSEIGTLCAFSNTSHFIKLFRKQYDMTPACYRVRHQTVEPAAAPERQPVREALPA